MAELVVRLVFSLAVVLGLLLLLARVGMKRGRGRAGSPVRVLHRQALSRTSAVTVVTVGSRLLVLGVTEHQVRVLTELDADELGEFGELGDLAAHAEIAPVARLVSAPEPGLGSFAETLHAQTLHAEDLHAEGLPAQTGETAVGTRGGRHAADRTRGPARGPAKGPAKGGRRTATAPASPGPFSGSVLSPHTWRQAVQAVSGRAS